MKATTMPTDLAFSPPERTADPYYRENGRVAVVQ